MTDAIMQQKKIAAQTIVDSIVLELPKKLTVEHSSYGFAVWLDDQDPNHRDNYIKLENRLFALADFEGQDKEGGTLFFLKDETADLIEAGMAGKEAAELMIAGMPA